jgi:hypothetical protein
MNRQLAVAALTAAMLSAAAPTTASEFFTYVPGTGSLVNSNATGGAGFAPVSVTGYSGVGGQFSGYYYTEPSRPVDSFFRFFCIELSQSANVGPNPYSSSLLNDDELRKLYDVAYPNKTLGDFWNGGQTAFGTFANATMAAAFQVAVWNIVFDNDLSLASGAFRWTGAASAVSLAAQNLLNQVASYSGTGFLDWTLYRFISPVEGSSTTSGFQNYVSATYRVPEPGTLGLAGLALVAVALIRRRG